MGYTCCWCARATATTAAAAQATQATLFVCLHCQHFWPLALLAYTARLAPHRPVPGHLPPTPPSLPSTPRLAAFIKRRPKALATGNNKAWPAIAARFFNSFFFSFPPRATNKFLQSPDPCCCLYQPPLPLPQPAALPIFSLICTALILPFYLQHLSLKCSSRRGRHRVANKLNAAKSQGEFSAGLPSTAQGIHCKRNQVFMAEMNF